MVAGQVQRISRHGSASAVVIDRPILDSLGIDDQTDLLITTDGAQLIIRPLTEAERAGRFDSVMKRTGEQNADLFRRLAK